MANPTTSDLTTYLTSMGITAAAEIDEQAIIDSAIAELEAMTGRKKFQGDATNTAIRYSLPWPQGKNVVLPIQDCWSLFEVRINYTGTSGTGTVLTEYDDFTHVPLLHAQNGGPIEAIQFSNAYSLEPGSILITGKLGYASSMPQDVFNAVLARCAAQVVKQSAGASGNASMEKQGDRQVQYGMEAGQSTYDRLMQEFTNAVSRYLKVQRL